MSENTFFKEYLNHAEFQADDKKPSITHRVETRSRLFDVTDALRFRVHDPLWMLSRQWQMGEFRGNDAGTAMGVRCTVKSMTISGYGLGDPSVKKSVSDDDPIEPMIESIKREITPLVRVESAMYFVDLLYDSDEVKDVRAVVDGLLNNPVLLLSPEHMEWINESSINTPDVKDFTSSRNLRLKKFARAYSGRKMLDGYILYTKLAHFAYKGVPSSVSKRYRKWFEDRYAVSGSSGAWDIQSLGYKFQAENPAGSFEAGDYSGGRVSWYSFDSKSQVAPKEGSYEVTVEESLPTLATYPGAPKKRLWEFEDRKVFMGNSSGMQAKGNIAFLQFATMYSNDWMLFPLKTRIGSYIEIDKIEVYDTFGVQTVITNRAGRFDKGASTFGQKWQMFTNAPLNQEGSAASASGLLFPPSLLRTLEGEPLEEVQFLRDEMANMVWGVETKIEDGCGSSIDAGALASEVRQYIDDIYEKDVEKARLSVKNDADGKATLTSDRKSDYKYSLMTSVPLNWIPFVPQHVNSAEEKKLYSGFLGGREVILRRGKMPYYHLGEYHPVRPLSSVLEVQPIKKKDGSSGEKPFFIEEEQVQGVGTVVVKNCQRSRWIGGKTYTWMGYSKQIKHTQGVSGLEYDNLLEPTK